MDEKILAPIGLIMGIIAASAQRIRVAQQYGCGHQLIEQERFYRKFHLPIQGRSPPLSNLQH